MSDIPRARLVLTADTKTSTAAIRTQRVHIEIDGETVGELQARNVEVRFEAGEAPVLAVTVYVGIGARIDLRERPA